MGKGFKHGAGGTSLNYKVITVKPSSPKANDIWVNTSKKITDHVFSLEEPAKVEGRVWFLTTTISTVKFNALKKNTIIVYPTSAKQCVNGNWIDVPFQTWIDGAWKEAYTYLFRSGDQCTDITGGWSDIEPNAAVLSRHYAAASEDGKTIDTCTANAIDITSFKRVNAQVASYDETFRLIVTDTAGNEVASVQATAPGIVSLDISGLSGLYKIKLYASANDYGGYVNVEFTVSEVWLS